MLERPIKRCIAVLGLRRYQYRYLYLVTLSLFILFFYFILFLNLDVQESKIVNDEVVRRRPVEAVVTTVSDQSATNELEAVPGLVQKNRPILWLYGGRHDFKIFRNIRRVFETIGYAVEYTGTLESGTSPPSHWDVLWSHDHPFTTLANHISDLTPRQRLNHFPGMGFITNKVTLVLLDVNFVPKAFVLPRDAPALMKYVRENPDKKWIQKSNNHRGIKLVTSLSELDLDRTDKFIQEYVDNPLLIDDRRFDIGLYVSITSINPLRAYIYQGDWLIRFCPKDYHPFNVTDTEQYVISDNYTPIWEMPSFKKLFNDLEFSRKASMFAFLYSTGRDPELLSRKLEAAVREVLSRKEMELIDALNEFNSRNLFEMVRFDFVVDADMNIFLMEVNMSPNLSSGHFPRNRLMFEQIVFSLLGLVGLSRVSTLDETADMFVSGRDVHVYENICGSGRCDDKCYLQDCMLCKECLSADFEYILRTAYSEHVNRRTWRRVVPAPFATRRDAVRWNATVNTDIHQMSAANRKMWLWFRGKCIQDATWCR